jgi:hypothetical protein
MDNEVARPVTVELEGGEWVCIICRKAARGLPDMTPAINAGNPRAHVHAFVDHAETCPLS